MNSFYNEMKTKINSTSFGSITINKQVFDHDVIINLAGEVNKRKKKLSKAIYGTSHTISKDEAEYVFEQGAEVIIIGTGQYDVAQLSTEAAKFFNDHSVDVMLLPTKEAVEEWNKAEGRKVIGLFHVTC